MLINELFDFGQEFCAGAVHEGRIIAPLQSVKPKVGHGELCTPLRLICSAAIFRLTVCPNAIYSLPMPNTQGGRGERKMPDVDKHIEAITAALNAVGGIIDTHNTVANAAISEAEILLRKARLALLSHHNAAQTAEVL